VEEAFLLSKQLMAFDCYRPSCILKRPVPMVGIGVFHNAVEAYKATRQVLIFRHKLWVFS